MNSLTETMKRFFRCTFILAGLTLVFLSLHSIAETTPTFGLKTFATSKEAADALVKASETNDTSTLLALFMPNGNDLIESGDPTEDQRSRAHFAALAHQKISLVPDPNDPKKIFISVGPEDWPYPVPLVQKDGKWMFDTSEGEREIRARHIGAHELTAIEICEGYVEAQNQYAQIHMHQGVPEYAQKIVSSPGKQDGLYWEPKKGHLPPPVPKEFAKAAHRIERNDRQPFHGYLFRILTAQGPAAQGGAKNYIVDGVMTGGFALVAWPADYGVSGIVSFTVNHDGIVYQKDLGPDTAKLAPALTEFNPDTTWTKAKDE
jgi:hypothetical protein